MNVPGSNLSTAVDNENYSRYLNVDILSVIDLCMKTSNFTENETEHYIYNYYSYQRLDSILSTGSNYMNFFFCLFGLIGYIIHVSVLTQPEFQMVSFVYHRYIVFVELISCVLGLIQSISTFIDDSNVVVILIGNLVISLTNVIDMVSKTVALPMCFERIIALHRPKKFDDINQRKIAIPAIVLATMTGVLYLPDCWAYYLVMSDTTTLEASSFSLNEEYTQFLLAGDIICDIRSGLLVIMSTVIIVGLLKVRKHRKKMKTVAIDQTVNISILTLSVAIPAFLNDTLYTIYSFGPFASTIDICENLKLSFIDAVAEINSAVIRCWLSFINVILFLFCNCCHFYLYFLLSKSFRMGTFALFRTSVPETMAFSTNTVTAETKTKPNSKTAWETVKAKSRKETTSYAQQSTAF